MNCTPIVFLIFCYINPSETNILKSFRPFIVSSVNGANRNVYGVFAIQPISYFGDSM